MPVIHRHPLFIIIFIYRKGIKEDVSALAPNQTPTSKLLAD